MPAACRFIAIPAGPTRLGLRYAARALFVIDPFGTIAWSAVFPDAVDPGLDGILTALEGSMA